MSAACVAHWRLSFSQASAARRSFSKAACMALSPSAMVPRYERCRPQRSRGQHSGSEKNQSAPRRVQTGSKFGRAPLPVDRLRTETRRAAIVQEESPFFFASRARHARSCGAPRRETRLINCGKTEVLRLGGVDGRRFDLSSTPHGAVASKGVVAAPESCARCALAACAAAQRCDRSTAAPIAHAIKRTAASKAVLLPHQAITPRPRRGTTTPPP